VLGKKCLTHLLVQSMNLVQQAELIPPSVQSAATAGFDGQIHDAPSRLRCHQVQASCYQPTPTRQTSSPQGEGRYGYRSLPAQLVAPTWGVNWTLDEAELAPANTHEESLAGDLLRRVVGEYSWLRVTTAVGDAGLGCEPFVGVACERGVRRVVDLRADPRADHDKDAWGIRGYDDKGWSVCQ